MTRARLRQAKEQLTVRRMPQGGKPVPPPMLDEAASLEVMELTPAPVPSGFAFLGEGLHCCCPLCAPTLLGPKRQPACQSAALDSWHPPLVRKR